MVGSFVPEVIGQHCGGKGGDGERCRAEVSGAPRGETSMVVAPPAATQEACGGESGCI